MTTSESVAVPTAVPAVAVPATAAPAIAASLYVGELSPEVTEAMLFEIFNQIGPVSSIRICRDAITRRSLGYGYVNFHSAVDGEKALQEMNYAPIKGVPCRIMWSQRDPSVRRSGDGNVFIKDLDASIDNKSLHELFSSFGNILSCKVALDERGVSKGYGFVHFESKESADEAISKLNGLILNDKKVYVCLHVSRKDRVAQTDAAKSVFTNVFVKNLDENMDDAEVEKIFTPFGKITSAFVGRDESSGRSKGFAFVNFETHAAADAAVNALNGTELNGRVLFVGRAQKKAERAEELRRQFEAEKMERSNKFVGVNLYVKNLAESIDEEKLRHEFSPFGTVASCKVMVDEKGVSRGFGFVCYSNSEESARAVGEMNGRMLVGKPLYVAFAQRKDERRMQLEAQFSARAQQLRYQQQMAAAAAAAAGYPQAPMFYPQGGRAMMPMRQMNNGPNMNNGPMNPMNNQQRPPRVMRPGQMNANGTSNPNMMAPGAYAQRNPNNRRPYLPKGPRRPEPLTAAALAAATPEQQKVMLGERLYPLIHIRQPESASKITGMLLEMDKAELLHLIEAPEALEAKVNEAVDVLRKHQQAQQQQQQQQQVAAN